MRYYPSDEYDKKELERINAEEWMVELLKKNPDYCSWGNFEDYMWKDGDSWDCRCELESVKDLWQLDEYNELVNFYFEVSRENIECEDCEGSGLNKETKQLSDDWYDFNRTGKKWCYNITQNEVDALWEHNRLHCDFKEKPTADEVNIWASKSMGHDAINHNICVEARAKKEGIYGYCDKCHGQGRIYTEPKAHVALQMWFIHPRKGASRGVYLKNINKDE
jgi:hypothetical protein